MGPSNRPAWFRGWVHANFSTAVMGDFGGIYRELNRPCIGRCIRMPKENGITLSNPDLWPLDFGVMAVNAVGTRTHPCWESKPRIRAGHPLPRESGLLAKPDSAKFCRLERKLRVQSMPRSRV